MSSANDIIEVPLTRGYVAIVDAADAWVLQWKWQSHPHGNVVYADREVVRRKRISLHRQILGAEADGMSVDHIDGDGLNNRRSNLRVVTCSENSRNVVGARRDSRSGHRGVCKDKYGWRAIIYEGGKQVYLGSFDAIEDAITARLVAEREHWGIQPRRAQAHENAPLVAPPSARRMDRRNKSGVTGVRWNSKHQKWYAFITVDRCQHYLGAFADKQEAIAARLEAERQLRSQSSSPISPEVSGGES